MSHTDSSGTVVTNSCHCQACHLTDNAYYDQVNFICYNFLQQDIKLMK